MSIRFNCLACRAVLKVPEVVTVERKIRCTSCNAVMVLTPDEMSPTGMTTSMPDTSKKADSKKRHEAAKQQRALLIVLPIVLLALGGIIWWAFFTGPSNRGSVEGEVTVGGISMEKGMIIFVSVDDEKKKSSPGTIEKGRYKLTASEGPYIGKNKVEIYSPRGTGKEVEKPGGRPGEMMEVMVESIHADYNTQTKLLADIKAGPNTLEPFKVKAK
jgi:hypothetical protein